MSYGPAKNRNEKKTRGDRAVVVWFSRLFLKRILCLFVPVSVLILCGLDFSHARIQGQEIGRRLDPMMQGLLSSIQQNLKQGYVTVYIMPFREVKADYQVYQNNRDFRVRIHDRIEKALLGKRRELVKKGAKLSLVDPKIVANILQERKVKIDNFLGRLVQIKEQIPAMLIMSGDIYYFNEDIFVVLRLIHVESVTIVWGHTFCFSQWGRQVIEKIQKKCKYLDHCLRRTTNQKIKKEDKRKKAGVSTVGKEPFARVFSLVDVSKEDGAAIFKKLVFDIIEANIVTAKSRLIVWQASDLAAVIKRFKFESMHRVINMLANRADRATRPEKFILYDARQEMKQVKLTFAGLDGKITCVESIDLLDPPRRYPLKIIFHPSPPENLNITVKRANIPVQPPYRIEDGGDRVYSLKSGAYTFQFNKRDKAFEERFVIVNRSKSMLISDEICPWIIDVKRHISPECSEIGEPSDTIGFRVAQAYCLLENGEIDMAKTNLKSISYLLEEKGCPLDALDPDILFLFYLCQGKVYRNLKRYHVATGILEKALITFGKTKVNVPDAFMKEMRSELYTSARNLYDQDCKDVASVGDSQRCRHLRNILKYTKKELNDF